MGCCFTCGELDPRLLDGDGRPSHYQLRLCLSGWAARDLREVEAEAEVLAGGCDGHQACLGRLFDVAEC